MWLYVLTAVTVALAVASWRQRRQARVLTSSEREQMKALPLFTGKWAEDEWAKWRALMDADLVQVSDVEGDFGPSYMLTLTSAGERALGL